MEREIVFFNEVQGKKYYSLTGEEHELLNKALFTGFYHQKGERIICGGDSLAKANYVSVPE